MNKHDQIVEALKKLVPNASYGVRGEKIEWEDKKVSQPSQSELETAMAEVVEESKKLEYQYLRYKEYPSIQECIHAILDDDLTALQAKRKLVKDKYPKPE
tara:strand:- start:12 stop:311 length:300 start_codon:yes stop_codon:yes gene_type:complete